MAKSPSSTFSQEKLPPPGFNEWLLRLEEVASRGEVSFENFCMPDVYNVDGDGNRSCQDIDEGESQLSKNNIQIKPVTPGGPQREPYPIPKDTAQRSVMSTKKHNIDSDEQEHFMKNMCHTQVHVSWDGNSSFKMTPHCNMNCSANGYERVSGTSNNISKNQESDKPFEACPPGICSKLQNGSKMSIKADSKKHFKESGEKSSIPEDEPKTLNKNHSKIGNSKNGDDTNFIKNQRESNKAPMEKYNDNDVNGKQYGPKHLADKKSPFKKSSKQNKYENNALRNTRSKSKNHDPIKDTVLNEERLKVQSVEVITVPVEEKIEEEDDDNEYYYYYLEEEEEDAHTCTSNCTSLDVSSSNLEYPQNMPSEVLQEFTTPGFGDLNYKKEKRGDVRADIHISKEKDVMSFPNYRESKRGSTPLVAVVKANRIPKELRHGKVQHFSTYHHKLFAEKRSTPLVEIKDKKKANKESKTPIPESADSPLEEKSSCDSGESSSQKENCTSKTLDDKPKTSTPRLCQRKRPCSVNNNNCHSPNCWCISNLSSSSNEFARLIPGHKKKKCEESQRRCRKDTFLARMAPPTLFLHSGNESDSSSCSDRRYRTSRDKHESLCFTQKKPEGLKLIRNVECLVMKYLRDRWRCSEMCDVVIKTRSDDVFAHKVVIAAHSPRLAREFIKHPTDVVELRRMRKFSQSVVQQCMKYAYTGWINVGDTCDVAELLHSACELGFESLQEALLKQVGKVTPDCAVRLHRLASIYNLPRLRKNLNCDSRDKLKDACRSKSFLRLSCHKVKDFLCCMEADDELEVLKAGIKWIKCNMRARLCYAPEILKCVRLERLTPKQLMRHVAEDECFRQHKKCMDIVNQIMCQHALRLSAERFNDRPPHICRTRTRHREPFICQYDSDSYVSCYHVHSNLDAPVFPGGRPSPDGKVATPNNSHSAIHLDMLDNKDINNSAYQFGKDTAIRQKVIKHLLKELFTEYIKDNLTDSTSIQLQENLKHTSNSKAKSKSTNEYSSSKKTTKFKKHDKTTWYGSDITVLPVSRESYESTKPAKLLQKEKCKTDKDSQSSSEVVSKPKYSVLEEIEQVPKVEGKNQNQSNLDDIYARSIEGDANQMKSVSPSKNHQYSGENPLPPDPNLIEDTDDEHMNISTSNKRKPYWIKSVSLDKIYEREISGAGPSEGRSGNASSRASAKPPSEEVGTKGSIGNTKGDSKQYGKQYGKVSSRSSQKVPSKDFSKLSQKVSNEDFNKSSQKVSNKDFERSSLKVPSKDYNRSLKVSSKESDRLTTKKRSGNETTRQDDGKTYNITSEVTSKTWNLENKSSKGSKQTATMHEVARGLIGEDVWINEGSGSTWHERSGKVEPRPHVVAVGGIDLNLRDKEFPGRSVFRLDLNNQEWYPYATLRVYTHHHGVATVGGRLYVIGGAIYNGLHPNNLGHPTNRVYMFEPRPRIWTELSPMTERRAYHSVCSYRGKIYVVGGENDNLDKLGTIEIYTPETNSWYLFTKIPGPGRLGASTIIHDGFLWVIGGFNREVQPLPILSDVFRYNLEYNHWETMNNLLVPRCHAHLAEVFGRLYLIGGRSMRTHSLSTSYSTDTIELYDDASDSWQVVGNLEQSRHDAACTSMGSAIYIIGGITAQNPVCLDTTEVFDVISKTTITIKSPFAATGIACSTLDIIASVTMQDRQPDKFT